VARIGTMGYNARRDTVLTTLSALEAVLRRAGAPITTGGGVGAAHDVYTDADRAAAAVPVSESVPGPVTAGDGSGGAA
jgi:(S)-ureidoglycine-glyoxylate aminotransferase